MRHFSRSEFDACYEKAYAYARETHEEELGLLRMLAPMPSPSHHEERRAAAICQWLKDHGGTAYIDEANNVICPIGDDGIKPLVVFAAHTDVVFNDTETLPLEEDSDGYTWRCPGVGDDTANLCNLLMSAKYLLEHPFSADVAFLIVANSCEEGLGNLDGTRKLFEAYGNRVQEYISYDCYAGMCVNHAVGSHRYRISVDTEGGHSYANFGRPNAIKVLSEIICSLYALELPENPKTTCNAGTIKGGTSVNTIAQHAEMLFEFRSASDGVLKTMAGKLYEVLAAYQSDEVQVQAKEFGRRPGDGEIDEEKLSALTERSSYSIAKAFGQDAELSANSTDGNIPLSLGIPANTIGTVRGAGAHTREEWIDTRSLIPGCALALSLMLDYVA
ncbi:MAG: M20/M25/M40 family metallo-hydrolase [Atopobiaceae bacterium]